MPSSPPTLNAWPSCRLVDRTPKIGLRIRPFGALANREGFSGAPNHGPPLDLAGHHGRCHRRDLVEPDLGGESIEPLGVDGFGDTRPDGEALTGWAHDRVDAQQADPSQQEVTCCSRMLFDIPFVFVDQS